MIVLNVDGVDYEVRQIRNKIRVNEVGKRGAFFVIVDKRSKTWSTAGRTFRSLEDTIRWVVCR